MHSLGLLASRSSSAPTSYRASPNHSPRMRPTPSQPPRPSQARAKPSARPSQAAARTHLGARRRPDRPGGEPLPRAGGARTAVQRVLSGAARLVQHGAQRGNALCVHGAHCGDRTTHDAMRCDAMRCGAGSALPAKRGGAYGARRTKRSRRSGAQRGLTTRLQSCSVGTGRSTTWPSLVPTLGLWFLLVVGGVRSGLLTHCSCHGSYTKRKLWRGDLLRLQL